MNLLSEIWMQDARIFQVFWKNLSAYIDATCKFFLKGKLGFSKDFILYNMVKLMGFVISQEMASRKFQVKAHFHF